MGGIAVLLAGVAQSQSPAASGRVVDSTRAPATVVTRANSPNDVTVITGDDLNRVPTPTIENAMQGRIPGALISTNSGAPGGGAQVAIRGATTIFGSFGPIYVVDGVIVSNAEISNGLNVITRSGSSIQDQPANRVADLDPADIESIEVLKGPSAGAAYGSRGMDGVIVITTKRGRASRPTATITERVGKFSLANELGLRCYGSAAEASAAFGTTGAGAYTASGGACHDFESEFYGGNSLSHETDLSLRGGGANTTYYIGGLDKRDAAIQRGTYFNKQSISANLTTAVGPLNLRANNQFIHSRTDRGISGNDNADISPGAVFSETPTFVNLASGIKNPFSSFESNPFQAAALVTIPENVDRYIGSINATVSLWSSAHQSVDVAATGGLDMFSYGSTLTSPAAAYFEPNDGLAGTLVTGRERSKFANFNASGTHAIATRLFTARTTVGIRREHTESDLAHHSGTPITPGNTDPSAALVTTSDSAHLLIRDVGYYAQEELLALDERLLLTAAISRERSSVEDDTTNFRSYPKLGASYRVPFLPRFTDDLKLRVAYGKAGIPAPLGVRVASQTGLAHATPEKMNELEGGVDASFTGGRIATDLTMYRRIINDLVISSPTVPGTAINGADMQYTGTEIGVTLVPIQRGNMSWLSRMTFANTGGRVTRLDAPCFNPGPSLNSTLYGVPYVCKGYSPTSVQARNGYDSTFTCGPTGTCNTGTFLGRSRHISVFESAPDFTMGFSNEFSIGAIRLHTLLDWRSGGYDANVTNNYFDLGTVDGLGSRADTAAAHARNISVEQNNGSYLEKAGFLKLREVSLSWTLPAAFMQRTFASFTRDVRLELSGRNLKTWTKYTGYDPEVSNFGSLALGRFQDITPYPPSRSVFVSLSAGF